MKKFFKWFMIVIAGGIGLVLLFFIILLTPWYRSFAIEKPAEKMIDYVKEHPNKSAMTVIKNGEVLFERNGDQPMPLASTFKIIVASTYAQQVDQGAIDPKQEVALDQLDSYYAANTDGGAHPAWIKEMKEQEKIKKNKIALKDVAKGMITYSSNANTEYLMDLLGLDAIAEEQKSLDLNYQEKPYYFTSAMFIGNWIQQKEELTTKQLQARLRNLSDEEYRDLAAKIHQELKEGTYKAGFDRIDASIDQIWSDRLIKGTTRDYAELMEKIQKGEDFSDKKEKVLRSILETEEGFGQKGGSTEFVLTEATYLKNKKDESFSTALFLNHLTAKEQKELFHIPSVVRVFKLAPFDSFSEALRAGLIFDGEDE